MGDTREPRKQFQQPRKRWDKSRLEKEKKIIETFGLKNKRELRRIETTLRKKKNSAKGILALPVEDRAKRENELIESLKRIGVLSGSSTSDDVLTLSVEELLERRLQTVVYRKNLAKTVTQARQFITHGHIAVNERKVTAPSYIVLKSETDKVNYYGKPLQLEPPKAERKEELKKAFEEVAVKAARTKTAKPELEETALPEIKEEV